MDDKLKTELRSGFSDILFDEPMKNHTTFRTGGNADAFANAGSVAEITALKNWCSEKNVDFIIIGNGSDLLVSDKGIRGLVVSVGSNMSGCTVKGNIISAYAGTLMSSAANAALKASLTGFEALSGIPGTLGGGIYMNAGAYGGEIKNILKSVKYIDENGKTVEENMNADDFSYRHSPFTGKSRIIISAELELKYGESGKIKAAMNEYSRLRAEKQPISLPSAGSTFKRPEGYFAGKLISDSGLRGFSIGGAQVSEKHAGFVVNTGSATSDDIYRLIRYIQKTVREKYDVGLETEVRMLGDFE